MKTLEIGRYEFQNRCLDHLPPQHTFQDFSPRPPVVNRTFYDEQMCTWIFCYWYALEAVLWDWERRARQHF